MDKGFFYDVADRAAKRVLSGREHLLNNDTLAVDVGRFFLDFEKECTSVSYATANADAGDWLGWTGWEKVDRGYVFGGEISDYVAAVSGLPTEVQKEMRVSRLFRDSHLMRREEAAHPLGLGC